MKRITLTAGLAAVLLLVSCVKRHKCVSHLRVKSVYNALMGYTSTYYYNRDGNLTAVSRSNGTHTDIDYTDKSVSGKTVDKDGHTASTWFCYLNNRGLVDSMIKRDSSQIISTKKFIYDNQAFAIEEREYTPEKPMTITRKTVNNGDVLSFSVVHTELVPASITLNPATGKNDTVSITATGRDYTVYNEFIPTSEKTMAFGNYGSAEFGEGNRNIEKRTVQISPEGDTMDVSVFKYNFDRLGRVSMCVTRNLAGELIDSSYITYY